MEKKKQKKIILIAVAALLAIALLLGGAYLAFRPKGESGAKTIEVSVVLRDASSTEFTIKTEAEMLGEALLDEKLVEGDMGEFGLFITKVNGTEADATQNEWWCITKAGAQLDTGADSTPIADKDKFELTLSTY